MGRGEQHQSQDEASGRIYALARLSIFNKVNNSGRKDEYESQHETSGWLRQWPSLQADVLMAETKIKRAYLWER